MFGYSTDQYMGFRVMDFDRSDAFRIEKYKERWFFVTPDGHPYILFGANHSDVHDKDHVKSIFMKRYSKEKNCEQEIANEMEKFGFNAAFHGYYSGIDDFIPVNDVIHCTHNNYYRLEDDFLFDDVFDKRFKENINMTIESKCKQVRNNPRYIGYMWTQAPRWDIDISRATRGTDWVSTLRTLPPKNPGHKRYKEYIRRLYCNDLKRFNRLYGQNISNFNEKIDFTTIDINEHQIRNDDEGFLRLIARELFSHIYENIRRFDKVHLNFGDKLLLYDHPDCVLEELSQYVDAVAIQPGGGYNELPFTPEGQPYYESYFEKEVYDHIHRITGKPIIIADFNISFKSEKYPRTTWFQCCSEGEAAQVFATYAREAFSQPYVIGIAHCEYFSNYKKKKDFFVLRQGIISPEGDIYRNYVDILKENNEAIVHDLVKAFAP